MNQKILELILDNKDKFVPLIFTKKQIHAMRKYKENKKLSNAEKKALYTSIKKKVEALTIFSRNNRNKEYFINGSSEMLSEKLEEAEKLLDKYSKKYEQVFISGSFLFSKTYNDIDIFIIRQKGYKEKWEGNQHLIFLTIKNLSSPVFQSASLISISNFPIQGKTKKKRPMLSQLMSTYHEAVIERINKEKKPESIRRLVFDYNLFCKNTLLNPKELKLKSEQCTLDEMDNLLKELCSKLFSESYLYIDIHSYIRTLEQSIKNIQLNYHLIRFKKTYEELIYGSERIKEDPQNKLAKFIK